MTKKYLSILFALFLLLSGCGKASMSDSESISSSNKVSYDSDIGWDTESRDESTENPNRESELVENDLENRKLIKTVYLTMETTEFDRMKSMLDELIPAYGGYIQESNYYDPQRSDRYRDYALTVRIPADNLDAFTTKIGLLGTLTNKSEKLDDVTLTYVDMTAYKEALETEYAKILELLEEADDLDQILVLESKLSELRYEINSYESQLRMYDNLISYSTIHIDISEVAYETSVDDSIQNRISTGFIQSLSSIRDFFVDLLVFFLGNLPVIVLIVFALLLTRFIFQKTRKRFGTKNKHNDTTTQLTPPDNNSPSDK